LSTFNGWQWSSGGSGFDCVRLKLPNLRLLQEYTVAPKKINLSNSVKDNTARKGCKYTVQRRFSENW